MKRLILISIITLIGSLSHAMWGSRSVSIGTLKNAKYNTLSIHNMGNTAVTVNVHAKEDDCGSIMFENIKPGETKTLKIGDNVVKTEEGLQTQCTYGSAHFYKTGTGNNWGTSDIDKAVAPREYPINEGPVLWVNNSWHGQWGIGVEK